MRGMDRVGEVVLGEALQGGFGQGEAEFGGPSIGSARSAPVSWDAVRWDKVGILISRFLWCGPLGCGLEILGAAWSGESSPGMA